MGAICRAFATFGRKQKFNLMRAQAMAQTFGWNNSAPLYQALYQRVGG